MSFSVAAVSAGSEDKRLLPSMARKSEVKLLRSPSARVVGSQTSATSADSRLKLLSRQMLNEPSTADQQEKTPGIPRRGESGSIAAAASRGPSARENICDRQAPSLDLSESSA